MDNYIGTFTPMSKSTVIQDLHWVLAVEAERMNSPMDIKIMITTNIYNYQLIFNIVYTHIYEPLPKCGDMNL